MKLGKSFIDRNLLGIKLWDAAECGSFWSWVDLSWVVSSKFRGWVVSDLVGGSFRPIFRVSHFGLWLFWPKSESYNVCIICVWMDRWAGVKFCEKIRLKCKKGPFTTQAKTILLKMPWVGPKRPVSITVWLGEIKRIYRENNSKT